MVGGLGRRISRRTTNKRPRASGARQASGSSGAAGAGSVALSAQDFQPLPVLLRVDLTRGVPAREDLLRIVVVPRAPGPVRPWAPGPVWPWAPGPVWPWAPGPVWPWAPGPVWPWAPGPVWPRAPGPVWPWAPGPVWPWAPGPVWPWAPGRPGTRPRAAFPPYSGCGRSGPAGAGPARQRDDRPDDQAPEDERGEDTEAPRPSVHSGAPVPHPHHRPPSLLDLVLLPARMPSAAERGPRRRCGLTERARSVQPTNPPWGAQCQLPAPPQYQLPGSARTGPPDISDRDGAS